MKKLFTILILAALAMPAFGQFVSGPRVYPLLSIPAGGYILDSHQAVSNVAGAIPFRIKGNQPLVLGLSMGGTNATYISNIYFGFQLSLDGSHWMGPLPAQVEWCDGLVENKFPMTMIPIAGLQQGLTMTNITGTVNLASYNWIRLYSISNCNKGIAEASAFSNTMYITNLWMAQGD